MTKSLSLHTSRARAVKAGLLSLNFFNPSAYRHAPIKKSLIIFATLFALVCLPATQPMQAAVAQYDVSHQFIFRPGGNIVPVAQNVWSTNALTQGGVSDIKSGTTPMGPSTSSTHTSMSAGVNGSSAFAYSNATLNAFGVGGPVTGSVRVMGIADSGVNAWAIASSYSRIDVRGGNLSRRGQIVWRPILSSAVFGRARAGIRDPIDFEVFDLVTQTTLSGSLLDIDLNLNDTGNLSWGSGGLVIDALNLDFKIDLNSPYLAQNGLLDFVISNGVVTRSNSSGMFAGLLPSLGSTGTFNIPLSEFTLDYDLGDFSGHDLDIDFGFSGGGEASAVPEPGTIAAGIALLGLCLQQAIVRRCRYKNGSLLM